jgi:hypothetical protein
MPKLSIRTKLLGAFGLVVVLMVVLTVFSITRLNASNDRTQTAVDKTTKAAEIVGSLGYDVTAAASAAEALERLEDELDDPRLDYLLGGLPVLPLPDASVHRVVGDFAPDDPEIARVTALQGE